MFDDRVNIAVTPHALVLSEDADVLASVGADLAAAGWTVSGQPLAMLWRSVGGAPYRPQLLVVDAATLDARAAEFLQMVAAVGAGPATALLVLLPADGGRSVQASLFHGTLSFALQRPFSASDLRTLAEATQAAQFLAAYGPEPDMLVIGLMELIANAIEHGNLGISYREKTALLLAGAWSDEVERRIREPQYRDLSVSVEMRRERESLNFLIVDQGRGFDPRPYLALDPQRAFDPNGRGIAMARTISFTELEYLGCGNRVLACVRL